MKLVRVVLLPEDLKPGISGSVRWTTGATASLIQSSLGTCNESFPSNRNGRSEGRVTSRTLSFIFPGIEGPGLLPRQGKLLSRDCRPEAGIKAGVLKGQSHEYM